jgi:hypothetical protein
MAYRYQYPGSLKKIVLIGVCTNRYRYDLKIVEIFILAQKYNITGTVTHYNEIVFELLNMRMMQNKEQLRIYTIVERI